MVYLFFDADREKAGDSAPCNEDLMASNLNDPLLAEPTTDSIVCVLTTCPPFPESMLDTDPLLENCPPVCGCCCFCCLIFGGALTLTESLGEGTVLLPREDVADNLLDKPPLPSLRSFKFSNTLTRIAVNDRVTSLWQILSFMYPITSSQRMLTLRSKNAWLTTVLINTLLRRATSRSLSFS